MTSAQSAIVINASNVTVDLDGHTITTASSTLDTITNGSSGAYRNIHIRNGTIVGGKIHVNLTMSGGEASAEELTLVSNSGIGGGIRIIGQPAPNLVRIVVRNNTIVDSTAQGLFIEFTDNARVEENNIRGSVGTGMQIQFASNVLVARNTISNNTGAGLHLANGLNNHVTGNIVSNNLGIAGINLAGTNASIIDGNNVSGNVTGIGAANSKHNTITANNCSNGSANGIYLNNGDYNNVYRNVTSGNQDNGILLSGGASYNNIEGNVAALNGNASGECGIRFETTADFNIYTANRTYDNGLTCTTCGICDVPLTNTSGGGNLNVN